MLWHHYSDYVAGSGATLSPVRPNLFSALNLREIRHSDFWAWLLNPRESHQLGEEPFRKFLRLMGDKGDTNAARLVSAPVNDFSELELLREDNGADVLIISERHDWVGLVEMKVGATEGRDQLARYRRYLEGWFPEYRRSLAFMTLRGAAPTDRAFTPIAFHDWSPFFQRLVAGANRLDPAAELGLILADYRDLLLDRLDYFETTVTMVAPRVRAAFNRIWESHEGDAFSLLGGVKVWQQRTQRELEDFITKTITSSFKDGCFRPPRFPGAYASYMPFVPLEWHPITPVWEGGADPAFTGQLVTLTIMNFPFVSPFQNAENMGLTLVIGLTQPQSGFEPLREIIYEAARTEPDLFNTARKASGAGARKHVRLGVHCLVSVEECRRLSLAEVKARFERRWQRFHRNQYPRVVALLSRPEVQRYVP
ncbi:MAG: PD-(D/E)XK nuclease family protein [Verrucomicrobiota bacterium]|nr:PD-(D/E)XK nuclease family protein [Verrucomicrobiota bacterium]